MRTGLMRVFAIVILLLIIGGHISELFDRWDHTLQTGADADYTTVIFAASLGATFLTLAIRLSSPSRRKLAKANTAAEIARPAVDFFTSCLSSPSLPKLSGLRI